MMNKDETQVEMSEMITMTVCDKTVNHEVSGDCIIPDYQPEIRRLLNVTEKILPPAKYISASGAEFCGTVDYKILYIGADGGLYSTTLSSEYEFSAPMDEGGDLDLGGGVSALVFTCTENISTRVSSPRKLNIKSRLRSHVRVMAKMLLGEDSYGEVDPESIERLYGTADNAEVACGTSDTVTLSDEIAGLGEDVRVISADAYTYVSDVRASGNGVSATGEVMLKLLLGRDGECPQLVVRKLPFGTDIEVEGMEDVNESRVVANVNDITVNAEEGRILADLTLTARALCVRNMPWRFTADIYSTERESECDTVELSLPYAIVCDNGNFSQSERIPLSETGIAEEANVIDSWGSVTFDTCEASDGKYILSGQSKYTLLCENDGEYSCAEVNIPVKYEIMGDAAEDISFDAFASVISCRTRKDQDTLGIDSEIAVATDIFGKSDVRAVSNVRFGEALPKEKCRMVVYYPSKDEGVWDVAKKYHVPQGSLSESQKYYFI